MEGRVYPKWTIPIAILALLVSTVALLRTPSKQAVGTTPSGLDRIRRDRKIRAGYVKFAPCADISSSTGKLEGIFVDGLREVAADLKMEIEFRETTLATFTAALESGEIDFSVGPTFITPSRSLAVSYTQPVLALGNSGLVKKQSAADFTDPSSLGKPGLRIAVLQGQAMEEYVRSRHPTAQLIVISGSDLTSPLLAVKAGQADIGLSNSVTVQQFATTHPDTVAVFTSEEALLRLALAWVVRSEDDRLRSFLDSCIDWLKQSGKLSAIEARYPVRLSPIR